MSEGNNMSHAQLEIFGMNRFHNTLPLNGEEVEKAENRARRQEDNILEFMQHHPRSSFTPPEIHLLFGQKWPLTSVRRALTNLTGSGHLKVTDELRPGLYGMKNHCWQVKPITS